MPCTSRPTRRRLTTYEIAGAGELVALQSGLRVVDPSLSVCVGLSAVLTTSEAIAPVEMISCSKAAEVVVTPDGASLFASNRGFGSPLTNTIAGFSIDARGLLTNVSSTASGVSYPRGVRVPAPRMHVHMHMHRPLTSVRCVRMRVASNPSRVIRWPYSA